MRKRIQDRLVSLCCSGFDIPGFIAKVAEEDFEGAYEVLSASSALPAVCGRVCPQENQCEGKCVRGVKGESVAVGRLERFVADWHREHCDEQPAVPEQNGQRSLLGSVCASVPYLDCCHRQRIVLP